MSCRRNMVRQHYVRCADRCLLHKGATLTLLLRFDSANRFRRSLCRNRRKVLVCQGFYLGKLYIAGNHDHGIVRRVIGFMVLD